MTEIPLASYVFRPQTTTVPRADDRGSVRDRLRPGC